jgi:hypothetical protein
MTMVGTTLEILGFSMTKKDFMFAVEWLICWKLAAKR